MELRYYHVDVFTTTPLEGNPLAVFPDATGLESGTMQRIARELNLSETTFILPQESSDLRTRVRIFTPSSELPFAGVPTIGTAFVMLKLGIVPGGAERFVLQEDVGDVAVRVDDGEDPIIWLTMPPVEKLEELPSERCAPMLGLQSHHLVADVPCEVLSGGIPFIFVAVDRPATVDGARLDVAVFEQIVKHRLPPTCVLVFAPTASGAYSRMFGPQLGIAEDPATGKCYRSLSALYDETWPRQKQ